MNEDNIDLAMQGAQMAVKMIKFAQQQGIVLDAMDKREIMANMAQPELAEELLRYPPSQRNKILQKVVKDRARAKQGHKVRGLIRAGKVGGGLGAGAGLGMLALTSTGAIVPLTAGAAAAAGATYGVHHAYRGGLHGYRLLSKKRRARQRAEALALERAVLGKSSTYAPKRKSRRYIKKRKSRSYRKKRKSRRH